MTVISMSTPRDSTSPTGRVITSLPVNAKAVTASNTDTFDAPVSIFVGVGGTVTVTPASGQTDVQFTVPAGGFVPCLVTAVKSTGTAATGLVAVY